MVTRVILFDFDGVIADSFSIFCKCFFESCKTVNINKFATQEDILRLFYGNFYQRLKDELQDEVMANKVMEVYFIKLKREIGKIKLFAGMDEVLMKLSKLAKIFIITSNREEIVREVLINNKIIEDLEIFGSEQIKSKSLKIQSILKNYNNFSEIFFITDTVGDVLEVKKFPIKIAGVAWGWHKPEELLKNGVEIVFKSPKELLEKFS
ncbi:HAD family hydrolase [Carboxydothermus ferrireducens]|uniref:Phosphoglycolate phosphatase n=1 Tax=Carboxydothermus ferrireducens DSM 11255 TaxID=1119529 RepID=A0ABX2RD31_9THEO|nr:HAD hydrolase-like protein [Carboxydothermus ferrireducens]NYE58507.1 phosphoglycolate phosphatase [Carboxydothermus ferrireducens DSM 11255]